MTQQSQESGFLCPILLKVLRYKEIKKYKEIIFYLSIYLKRNAIDLI